MVRASGKAKGTVAIAAFVVALVPAALFVGSALAGPTTPTPTILSGPADPSASTSATFTYRGTAAVTFRCSLNGGSYTACGSGTATTSGSITYTNLAQGNHTFRVTAKAKTTSESSPATRSWRVDTSAPTVTRTFPSGGGIYNGAGWAAGCATAGLCGTAADPSGVASVRVALLQQSGNKYWNGAGFTASSISYQAASGTSAWAYALAASAMSDGLYTVSLAATDGLGNATSTPTVSTFRIDTAPPPAPVISGDPDDPTPNRGAEFHFQSSEASASYRCQLDGGAFGSCVDGVEYNDLPVGQHCFAVVAVDLAGNVSPPDSYCWTIILQGSFPIKGDLTQPMAPGVSQPLNLIFSNPESFDLIITDVSVTVDDATTKAGSANPGCVGSQHLSISRPFTGPVVVPAKSTRSLSDLSTPAAQWPLITMLDLPTNQDACKSTTFTFTYSGSATK